MPVDDTEVSGDRSEHVALSLEAKKVAERVRSWGLGPSLTRGLPPNIGHIHWIGTGWELTGFAVERERVEGGFRSLQTVLASGAFVRIARGVRPGRQFGHGDRADCDLDGQSMGIERLEVDDDRRVE